MMKLKYKNNSLRSEYNKIITIGPEGSNTDIEIPNDVYRIEKLTFQNFPELKRVVIPNNIKAIDFGAFEDCVLLDEIILPNNINEIQPFAFSNTNIRTINLPDSLRHIGAHAFAASGLRKVDIPNQVEVIDERAFFNCSDLEFLKIPHSVKYIGDNLCCGCDSLKEVIMEAECKLPSKLFNYCDNLEKIYITKESFAKSPDFIKEYSDKIEIINKSLDELLDEGKSFREASRIIKESNEIIK